MKATATWAELWGHVKTTLPEWRLESSGGFLPEHGGRLLLLRKRGVEPVSKLIFLKADGMFVDVTKETDHGFRVELADGPVIQPS